MRINKYLAHRGITSRRKADEWIQEGRVKVNGQIVNLPGLDVKEEDTVEVDDCQIQGQPSKKVYIKLNKPVDILSSVSDDRGRKTVVDLIALQERIYPVGRLDYRSQGLILLTNDGELMQKMLHPKYHMEKIYEVKVKGLLGEKEIQAFQEGIQIDGYMTKEACLKVKSQDRDQGISEASIHLWEGRNRQIRKMMEALGKSVLTLKRVSIGSLHLGDLEEGAWSYLYQGELDDLIKAIERSQDNSR